MKLNDISLPYPVLGISDDIIPALKDDCLVIDNTSDAVNYNFYLSFDFDNQDIKELINSGYAEYSCEIDCNKTLLRRSYTSSEKYLKITIPKKCLAGRNLILRNFIPNSFISIVLFL